MEPETRVERVPLDTLTPHPRNVREGDVGAISVSLGQFGQYRPIVVQRATMHILAGTHTWKAANALGWAAIDAVMLDVDDATALRIMLADNRTHDLGHDREQDLVALLAGLDAGQMQGTGWDAEDLDTLVRDLAAMEPVKAGRTGPDDVPDVPEEPYVKLGDVWRMGQHIIACDDARRPGALTRLLGDARAQCMWTDPPYGVSYEGGTKNALTMQNDGAEGIGGLLARAFANITGVLDPGAPVYVCRPGGPLALDFSRAFVGAGWQLHEELIWVKDSLVLGHSDYHYRHETVMYGWTPGPGRSGRGKHAGSRWHGGNSATTVFEVPRPKSSPDHPTSKPTALVMPMVLNSSRPLDAVLDPFVGSGTTIIVAEQMGRRCYAMDIDPRYAQVAIERWQAFTGQKATKEAPDHVHPR